MSVAIRIRDYDKKHVQEYKEVDDRTPLPVKITGGVVGTPDGDVGVFDGNVNISSINGDPDGKLTVQLTAEQVAQLRAPNSQPITGTVQVGNQKLDVMVLNDNLNVNVQNPVTVSNESFKVTVTNPVTGVTLDNTKIAVEVLNPITVANTNLDVTVKNPVDTVTVANPVKSVAIDGTVAVSNFPAPVTSVAVNNQPTVNVGNFPPAVTSVAVNNQPTVYPVTDNNGSLTVDGTVNVGNFPTPVTSVGITGTVPVTQSGTWNVTTTPSGTQAVSGNVGTTPPTLSTSSSALTVFRSPAVANAPVAVKTSAARVHRYHFGNPNSAPVFVHLYNATTANITVGTTTPLTTYMVAANAALDGYWPNSDNFSTAVSVAVTTTANGATSPTSGALINLGYV